MVDTRLTIPRVLPKGQLGGVTHTPGEQGGAHVGEAEKTTTTSTTPLSYDASITAHEERSRDARKEVGKTLDESRTQRDVTPRSQRGMGPTALLLQEKSTTTSSQARLLGDVLRRAADAGATAEALSAGRDALVALTNHGDVKTLLTDAGLARALLSSSSLKEPAELFLALLTMPAHAAPQLTRILENSHFSSADADAQRLWLAAFRTRVSLPPHTQQNLERFLDSPSFLKMPMSVQLAMFRVVRETGGHAELVDGLVRVAESATFRAMSEASQQSFATIVGTTLEVMRTGTDAQRTVLKNSLEHLLDEKNGIPVSFEELRPGVLGMADVDGHCIVINSNFRLDADDDIRHLATHTLAHEVNHIVNEPNEHAPPYERFMGEYRAWCVGFVAEHGRWPTGDEGRERIDYLLDVNDSYSAIAKAAQRNDADGRSIRKFAAQFSGHHESAPLPDPPGNLENARSN